MNVGETVSFDSAGLQRLIELFEAYQFGFGDPVQFDKL